MNNPIVLRDSNGLSGTFKNAAIFVGTVAVGFIAYKLAKAAKQKIAEKMDLKPYEDALKNTQSTLSYDQTQYFNMADTIEGALNRYWNDDEATTYDVLKQLKNPQDWYMLVKAFGHRTRGKSNWWPNPSMGLHDYLADALGYFEMKKVREILKAIGIII